MYAWNILGGTGLQQNAKVAEVCFHILYNATAELPGTITRIETAHVTSYHHAKLD